MLLRVAPDYYWFSISDSDLLLWASGIARSLGLDVEISEPDVTREHTALEAGLAKYCSLDADTCAIGLETLRA